MDMIGSIYLEKSMRAWGTPEFKRILVQEITQLDADKLPLQMGLTTGNYVSNTPFTVMVNSVAEAGSFILVKAGVFYQGIIGGCSCTDDPTPISDINEFCEIQLEINKASGFTKIALIQE